MSGKFSFGNISVRNGISSPSPSTLEAQTARGGGGACHVTIARPHQGLPRWGLRQRIFGRMPSLAAKTESTGKQQAGESQAASPAFWLPDDESPCMHTELLTCAYVYLTYATLPIRSVRRLGGMWCGQVQSVASAPSLTSLTSLTDWLTLTLTVTARVGASTLI